MKKILSLVLIVIALLIGGFAQDIQHTQNYRFFKPTPGSANWANQMNQNLDSIDTNLFSLSTSITGLRSTLQTLSRPTIDCTVYGTSFFLQKLSIDGTIQCVQAAMVSMIPAAQVQTDWNASSGLAQILNKPTIPAAQVQSDWNETTNTSVDYIKNKPAIPTNTNQLTNGANFIAASGAPVQSVNGQTGAVLLAIPAAQIQVDWNATSGLAAILNKPSSLSLPGVTSDGSNGINVSGSVAFGASSLLQDGTLVSPKRFGACGNATCDDTVAVQAAVTWMDAHGGMLYVLPTETYKLTSTIISVASHPWDLSCAGSYGPGGFLWAGSKGTMTGGTNNMDAVMIKIGNTSTSTAIVNVYGCNWDSINDAHRASAAIYQVRRSGPTIQGNKFNNLIDGYVGTQLTSTIIDNNWVYGVWRDGIRLDQSGGGNININTISHTNCGYNKRWCIYAVGGTGNIIRESSIQGNSGDYHTYGTGSIITRNGTSATITLTDLSTLDVYVGQNITVGNSTGANGGAGACDGGWEITSVNAGAGTVTYSDTGAADTCSIAAGNNVTVGARGGTYLGVSASSYRDNRHEDSFSAGGPNYRPVLVAGSNNTIDTNNFSGCGSGKCKYVAELVSGAQNTVFRSNYPAGGTSGYFALNNAGSGGVASFIADTNICDPAGNTTCIGVTPTSTTPLRTFWGGFAMIGPTDSNNARKASVLTYLDAYGNLYGFLAMAACGDSGCTYPQVQSGSTFSRSDLVLNIDYSNVTSRVGWRCTASGGCTNSATGWAVIGGVSSVNGNTGAVTTPTSFSGLSGAATSGQLPGTGNAAKVCTSSAAGVSGNFVSWDANGNCTDSGVSASGSGVSFLGGAPLTLSNKSALIASGSAVAVGTTNAAGIWRLCTHIQVTACTSCAGTIIPTLNYTENSIAVPKQMPYPNPISGSANAVSVSGCVEPNLANSATVTVYTQGTASNTYTYYLTVTGEYLGTTRVQ